MQSFPLAGKPAGTLLRPDQQFSLEKLLASPSFIIFFVPARCSGQLIIFILAWSSFNVACGKVSRLPLVSYDFMDHKKEMRFFFVTSI